MRNVDSRLLMEKMDEVRQCNSAHQAGETVHVDANSLALNVDRVTVMHGQGYSSQMSRQVSVSEHVGDGQWNEELLSAERLEALVANLAQHSRPTHHFTHHKVSAGRADIDRYLANVILDTPPRLLTGHPLDPQQDAIVVEVPSLPPLPPLQEMKRCQEADWFNKSKTADNTILSEPTDLDLGVSASPAHSKQQNKKSLPHKKRISRKLKRNTGNTTPQQQELVVINCGDEPPQEEILPDSFAAVPHQPAHAHAHPHAHPHAHGHAHPALPPAEHHIAHEMRPMLICQLCGEFYGEEQLKFYHHLKQHYEPPPTIIIENPVPGPELAMDKMTNTCIVDNVATLPDSIVELSLEGNKTMYQQIDKHVLYTTSDKSFYSSKVHYTMSSMDKAASPPPEAAKAEIYDQLELYSCSKCNKSFRKQKHCEDHIKEAHSNPKLEDMGEFSEPEDLMAGIHVAVEDAEHYEATLLPHLTVDNGHVHQDHVADHARHWYLRGSSPALGPCPPGADDGYCPVCPAPAPAPPPPGPAPATARQDRQDRPGQGPLGETHQLKAEVLQRILDAEVSDVGFADPAAAMDGPPRAPHSPPPAPKGVAAGDKKKHKRFECPSCARVFVHRNSLLYHVLSHAGKQHPCRDCGKGFYTQGALKIHKRVHNGDRPYKCEDCGRQFRQWSDLKYHRVSLHSLEKNFKCEFCDKEFARKYSLNVHRRIHTGEKNYKCDYCSKTFRASSYRLSHMRTHTGDRPYKCTQCDKCFRVAGDLRRHTLTHDKVRNRYVEHRKPKDEKPKKTKDIKTEVDDSPKLKKLAANITKAVDQLVNNEKTGKQKSRRIKKEGAPNITITNNKDAQFKVNTDYDNVYDTRQVEYSKFKEVYTEGVGYSKEDIDYKGKEYEEQMIYKESDQRMNEERELAMLKPIFRNNVCNDGERQVEYRAENTDGKMQIFTHVEKNFSLVPNSVTLEDIRHIERERELHGEPIETGFLDKLTAFYNIPAV